MTGEAWTLGSWIEWLEMGRADVTSSTDWTMDFMTEATGYDDDTAI